MDSNKTTKSFEIVKIPSGKFLKNGQEISVSEFYIDRTKEISFKTRPKFYSDNRNIIGDTKWKMLSNSKPMNQSDIYQMYAYGKKYEGTDEIHLIYPLNDNFPKKREYLFESNEQSDTKLLLKVRAFDCNTDEFK